MHSFYQFVVDAEALVKSQTLKGFNKELARQSNKDEAVQRYQVLPRQQVVEDEYSQFKSPLYYGAGVEFLSHNYFDFFRTDYNLVQMVSMDDWDNPQRDRGADHKNMSMKKQHYKKQGVISAPGSPVSIQTKGTLNPVKEHMTNDGSRIPNWISYALSEACANGYAYQTRLILFTLGKGIHYVLDNNSHKRIEVVNNKEIARKIDNNPFFWNEMRKSFGLPTLDISHPMDPEGSAVKMELDALDN